MARDHLATGQAGPTVALICVASTIGIAPLVDLAVLRCPAVPGANAVMLAGAPASR